MWFVRSLRHSLTTGGLHQRWSVLLIIIGKTVTAVTNPIFDYRHTISLPFFKSATNDVFDQRQTICSNNWNECKTTWPGVAHNEIPWLTKDIQMPECVRWKECKINLGIWGIFFPAHKQPWPVKSWLTGLWLARKNSNSVSFSELPQSLAKKNNCIVLHFIRLTQTALDE